MGNESEISWDQNAKEKFDQMIAKIPSFLRPIALTKVSKKAEILTQKENRQEVSEKDVVDAFFIETPFGFHGPMKTDMQDLGIDYRKYGYEK